MKEEREKGCELKKKVKKLPDDEQMTRDELMNMKESLVDLRVQLKKCKEEMLAAKMNVRNDDNDADHLRLSMVVVYAAANDAY